MLNRRGPGSDCLRSKSGWVAGCPIDNARIDFMKSGGFQDGDGPEVLCGSMGLGKLHHVTTNTAADFNEKRLAIALIAIGFSHIEIQQPHRASFPAVSVAIKIDHANLRQGISTRL